MMVRNPASFFFFIFFFVVAHFPPFPRFNCVLVSRWLGVIRELNREVFRRSAYRYQLNFELCYNVEQFTTAKTDFEIVSQAKVIVWLSREQNVREIWAMAGWQCSFAFPYHLLLKPSKKIGNRFKLPLQLQVGGGGAKPPYASAAHHVYPPKSHRKRRLYDGCIST